MVSPLYFNLLEATYKTLPVDRLWRGDVPGLDQDFDFDMDVYQRLSVNCEHV